LGEAINQEGERLRAEIAVVQAALLKQLDSLEEAVTAAVQAYIFARLICGRRPWGKRNLDRCGGVEVLTSVRPLMRPLMPRARMGVRGPAPYQDCVLEAP
jgi:hypothetical protein